MSRRRLREAPLARFLLVGLALFAGERAFAPAAESPAVERAALDDEALLVAEAFARGEHLRDDVVRRRLAQNLRFARPDDARSEDALVAEAIRLGMHESDLVVRRRLAQKMRLLLAEPARTDEPSEAELAAYLAAHAERFTEPERATLRQLYFAERADAERALPALRAGALAPEAAGEALPLPRDLPSHSAAELAARFGPAFAEAAWRGPEAEWFGPVPSAYGHHLVWIAARTPARRSELGVVRSEVREALLAERAEAAVRDGIAALRAR